MAVTFRNPVIPGFNPDPSVCRVGDTYWCVTSSFSYFPGVPLYRSRDLVTWEHVGNILDRPSQLDLLGTAGWISSGIYAPTLRHHDGVFHMVTTVTGAGGLRNFLVTATDPLAAWSDPVFIDVVGIDPDLAWDTDGNCWMHHSVMQVRRARIDPETGSVLSAPEPTWNGTGMHCPEAPHLYEIEGMWYLMIAEGGTERGHCVSIARAPSPTGPWESCPHNPILSHRSTSKPILNTGHGDLVQAVDGSWWMMLLAVRPKGVTPGFHVLGRETFLVPVEWHDGWPVVGALEEEMTVSRSRVLDLPHTTTDVRSGSLVGAATVDDFEAPALHQRWLTVRRPAAEFADLTSRPGSLVLRGSEETSQTLHGDLPVYVGRRQEHHGCEILASVEMIRGERGEAGLAVYMDKDAHYRIGLERERLVARVRLAEIDTVIGSVPRPAGPIVLAIRTEAATLGPDTIVLGHVTDAGFTEIARFDGRYLATEVCTGFVGRTLGMYAIGCTAAFGRFEYRPIDW